MSTPPAMIGASELRVIVALFVGGLIGLGCAQVASRWLLREAPALSDRQFAALLGGLALVTGTIAYLVAFYVTAP